MAASEYGHLHVVKLLLERGAFVDFQNNVSVQQKGAMTLLAWS